MSIGCSRLFNRLSGPGTAEKVGDEPAKGPRRNHFPRFARRHLALPTERAGETSARENRDIDQPV